MPYVVRMYIHTYVCPMIVRRVGTYNSNVTINSTLLDLPYYLPSVYLSTKMKLVYYNINMARYEYIYILHSYTIIIFYKLVTCNEVQNVEKLNLG